MNKVVKYILIILFAVILLTGSFAGGFVTGHFAQLPAFANLPQLGGAPLATPAGAANATPDSLKTLFGPFWETWTLVHNQYVDQPVDDVALMRGAISGMLASLGDSHTLYLSPQAYESETTQLSGGNYEGIGAWVDETGTYLKVVSPITGSPAEKAGVKPGDLIVGIDGKDMTGTSPAEARNKVLGPEGSVVTLTIQRAGVDKPFDIKVTRAKITIASVESKMLDNGVGYIKLTTFGEKTGAELQAALTSLLAQHPKGLILDLRNNGGGYLQTAVEVASQFIKQGIIVSEKYGDGKIDKNSALGGGLATDIPLVVLVNEGTASASEIVSGAIQDYGRGKLVGVLTYGKGSVQIWTPLSNKQGAVAITIAKWLTPKDRTIDKIGLTPDIVVQMTKDDYSKGLDPQLDAAVKALLDMLK